MQMTRRRASVLFVAALSLAVAVLLQQSSLIRAGHGGHFPDATKALADTFALGERLGH